MAIKSNYQHKHNANRIKHQRFYMSAEWRRLRLFILGYYPVCINFDLCGNVAEEIHHVNMLSTEKGWRLRLSVFDGRDRNLVQCCKSCHSKFTRAEQFGYVIDSCRMAALSDFKKDIPADGQKEK